MNMMVIGWQPAEYQPISTLLYSISKNYSEDETCYSLISSFLSQNESFPIDMPFFSLPSFASGASAMGFSATTGFGNLLCFVLYKGLERCVKLLIQKNSNILFKDSRGNGLSYYIQRSSNKNIGNIFEEAVKEKQRLDELKELEKRSQELEKNTKSMPMKEWRTEEVCWWISYLMKKNGYPFIETDLSNKINKNFITGSILSKMPESDIRAVFEVSYGPSKTIYEAIIELNGVTTKETQLSSPIIEIKNNPPLNIGVVPKETQVTSTIEIKNSNPPPEVNEKLACGRFLDRNDDDSIINTPLAPLILLRKNETPLSFEQSIQTVYLEEHDDILYESYIDYAEVLYSDLSEETKNGLTLDEFRAIYFYTLEWTPPVLNLYPRLNASLCSKDRGQTAPLWKSYLYYLFNGLRKIPIWKGSQDVYRGVAKNLVKLNPDKYSKGKKITWYGFTSTTTNLEKIQSFIKNADSTIFCINGCLSGRAIEKYSGHPDEAEILIPPGSKFEIVGIIPLIQVTMIQLKQIPGIEKSFKME